MKLMSFQLGVSYGTVNIFDCSSEIYLDPPIGDVHCQQGFSWLPIGVSVFSIHDLGSWDTEALLNEPVQLAVEAVRAIQIPFTVSGEKGVFVGSGGVEEFILNIPPGNYALTVEQGFHGHPQTGQEKDDAGMWCRLWFNLATVVEPKILIQDDELNPAYPLRLDKLPN